MEYFQMKMDSLSKNEEFARVVVAVFMSRLNPTLEEIDDVKTAVSEAVTNAVIHGYQGKSGIIELEAWAQERESNETKINEPETSDGKINKSEMDDEKINKSEMDDEKINKPEMNSIESNHAESDDIETDGRRLGGILTVIIRDSGIGMRDVRRAMEPMYTTDQTGTRSGMGFSFMEAFMDEVQVESVLGKGTTVIMKKMIGG